VQLCVLFCCSQILGIAFSICFFKLIRLIYFLTYKANCQVSQSGFFYPLGVGGFLRVLVISEFSYISEKIILRVRMFHIPDDILECKLHTKDACLHPAGLKYLAK